MNSRINFSINSIIFEIVDLSKNLFKISSKNREEDSIKIKKIELMTNDVNYEKKSSSNKKFHTKNSSSSSCRAKEEKKSYQKKVY